ncbi:Zinc finger CCHC domain-containing protein 8 TRAMP-like complex RNA-binding factor ZCCHC8 [Channa argus]|uniref:Zinc finger CCHC domain-containing protein 8 n=1 Tax=Channa argus TaxID=215402 RepID=A0A6G1PZK0_CHAAH|nr:Zinc finger CCHC domain-containing protein 8 TRAMP-like complex RNA-binding factor ZCCHC8 [Channa argus]
MPLQVKVYRNTRVMDSFGVTEILLVLDQKRSCKKRHHSKSRDKRRSRSRSRDRKKKARERKKRTMDAQEALARRKILSLSQCLLICTSVENEVFHNLNCQQFFYNSSLKKQCFVSIQTSASFVILLCQHRRSTSSSHLYKQHYFKVLGNYISGRTTTTDAFKVVGSVLYFTTFSVDKLGQPLVNENPQLTDGWDVPTYHQVFNHVIGADGIEIEMKEKRPKSMCFNCGSSTHQLRDCPKPKDTAAINERRKEFNQNNHQTLQSNQRYHADELEEREELLTALGIDGNTLPPLIYRMRQLGYPPGWLKEAEMENSGLTLYDGNATSNDGNTTENSNLQNISYDVSKLVDFPGFNVLAPHKMKDEFMQYGSIPMQSNHMKQNYAVYLSNNFPMPGSTCNKRRHESGSSPQLRKKTRSSPDRNSGRSSDMDIESDPGTPYHIYAPTEFQFQPPLPPGSPCFSSPPPLPQGTPPATPTPPPLPKGTPPSTPTNGSPALQGCNWVVVDETVEGTEDDLTLEELEEQQRLIWAALENADTATNSDCETPVMGTPVPSSPSMSTHVHADTETEEVEESVGLIRPAETCHSSENKMDLEESCPQSPGPVKVEEDSPQSPEPVKAQDSGAQGPGQNSSHNDSAQSPNPIKCQEDNLESPHPDFSNEGVEDEASHKDVRKITAVPHRSRFAAGIVPFEDTPEFTEVAEATGTYLRIRDVLKCSPRSLAKKK